MISKVYQINFHHFKDINKESKASNKTFTEEQDNLIKNMNDKINSLNETIENHVVEQNNFIESQNKLVQSTLNTKKNILITNLHHH